MTAKKQHTVHKGKLYYSMTLTAAMLNTTTTKLKQIMVAEGLDWANFRINGPIWISAESVVAWKARRGQVTPTQWTPTPGHLATYTGRTGSSRRNMLVIAEAVDGRFVVEAIGRKGVVVRLTVKRDSLIQPQPDLFG